MENLKKVVDIIFDSGAFLVVILLILYSGYCYYARVSKNAEIEKSNMLRSYIKEKYRQQKSHCGSYSKNTESVS